MTPRRRHPWPLLVALVSVGAVAIGGCLPAGVTTEGRAVNELWNAFLVPAIVVAGIVWGLTTYAIVRYRGRAATADQLPPQFSEDRRFEITWTVIPIVTVLVLFWLTLSALGRIEAHTDGGVDVEITAFRWQWRVDYPADGVSVIGLPETPAEMAVPVDEPVHVTLTSPDVIHSFYVPAFLFKRDATPGRPTEFEFTVEEAGVYRGQCAEFCGVGHAAMKLTVLAMSRADYEAWLVQRKAAAGGAR